jgi:hypothetical protein
MSAYDNWLTAPLRDQERAEAKHEWLCDKASDTECEACGETGTDVEDGEVLDFCEDCHAPCKGCKDTDMAKSWRGRCEVCHEWHKRGRKERRKDASRSRRSRVDISSNRRASRADA